MENAWPVLAVAQPHQQGFPKFSALTGIQLASDSLWLRTRGIAWSLCAGYMATVLPLKFRHSQWQGWCMQLLVTTSVR